MTPEGYDIPKYKKERCSLTLLQDPDVALMKRFVCKYRCFYNEPLVIDEEYEREIDITFNSAPIVGQTYPLTGKDITVAGTFSTRWVFRRVYENQNMNGSIKVIEFYHNKKLKLDITLSEMRDSLNSLNGQLIKGIYTFH
jgi:hypothetical protein